MAKTVIIELIEPRLGGDLKRIVLREPKLSEYMALGEPVSYVARGDSVYTVDNDSAVRGYLDTCVIEPDTRSYVDNLSLADAMRVKEALLGFFEAARGKMPQAAQTSSSLISESPTSAKSKD